jgi:carboxyl-terminal processing protease
VRLEVRHADGSETALTIERREIQTRALRGFRRGAEGWEHAIDPERRIAYVRMTQFLDRVAEDLEALLRPDDGAAPAGLILDLRFNGGGSLGAALRVADLFLAEGDIVRVVGREGQERVFTASADAVDLDLPIVVLVNEASASASEILAGALQHHGRAKVLGVRTYGKGTVQEVRPLGEGLGSVKLTVARYLLPSGRSIARPSGSAATDLPWGVDPDRGFRVGLDEAGQRSLFLARRRWELPFDQPSGARWSDPDWISAPSGDDGISGAGDPQLAAALRALQSHLDSGGSHGGSWPRVGDDPTPDSLAADELRRQLEARERLARDLESLDRRIAELRLAATSRPAERPAEEPGK